MSSSRVDSLVGAAQLLVHTGISPVRPDHRYTRAVPVPVDLSSGSAESPLSLTAPTASRLLAGAGVRPAIGTPLRADWAIVCGDRVPSRLELDTVGRSGVVERPAGGG